MDILYCCLLLGIILICCSLVAVCVLVIFGYFWVNGGPVVWCTSKRRLDGKTVLITGGNGGLGRETALDLARRGARVILACRNPSRAQTTVQHITETTGNNDVSYVHLDLADFQSVQKCAENILKTELHLDILIINAAAIPNYSAKTRQGYDQSFGVNYLGHFLLTYLLIDLLKSSTPCRVIVLSSYIHRWCTELNFTKKDSEGNIYPELSGYELSKLCCALFVKEFKNRYEDFGIKVYAVDPGWAKTDIVRNESEEDQMFIVRRTVQLMFYILTIFVLRSPLEGAQTTIYCAVEESLDKDSGKYYQRCQEILPSQLLMDIELSYKLWEESMLMIKDYLKKDK